MYFHQAFQPLILSKGHTDIGQYLLINAASKQPCLYSDLELHIHLFRYGIYLCRSKYSLLLLNTVSFCFSVAPADTVDYGVPV